MLQERAQGYGERRAKSVLGLTRRLNRNNARCGLASRCAGTQYPGGSLAAVGSRLVRAG